MDCNYQATQTRTFLKAISDTLDSKANQSSNHGEKGESFSDKIESQHQESNLVCA